MSISKIKFGVTANGDEVTKYTLKNNNGIEVSFIDLGGVITNLMMPDKDGNIDDIVLGYDTVAEYEVNMPSFGAPLGRYANRVSTPSAFSAFTNNSVPLIILLPLSISYRK